MTRKVQSETTSPTVRKALAPTGVMAMLTVKGDPVSALKGVRLPPGAEVAIVSSSPQTVEKLRNKSRARFGALRKIYAKTFSSGSKAQDAVINQAAFEPD